VTPDGRWAAVALTRADPATDRYTSQIWLAATDGSTPPRRFTDGWRDTAPLFSPDGRWLAFLRTSDPAAKPQLHVIPVDGGEARRLTDNPLGVERVVWGPGSDRLAYLARVPEPGRYVGVEPGAEPPRRITRYRYRLDDVGWTLDRPRHVFTVGTGDAAPVQVTEGPYDHTDLDWSPTLDLLAVTAARHDAAGDDLVTDVWVCGPDGSGLRNLTGGRVAAGQPRFAGDGEGVCFVGYEATKVAGHNRAAWYVPLGGGEPRRLTDARHHLGARNGETVAVADGLLYPNDNRGAVEVLKVPYGGGEPQPVITGPTEVIGAVAAGGRLVSTRTDATSWGELYAGETRLSSWNTGFDALPVTELTGSPVHGWLVHPPGDGPHPVLLMIHGGPYAQYGWGLFDEAQVLARAGYAVVMGNPRGSSGYGADHGRAIIHDVGAVSAVDLIALLDHALERDDLDPGRVGVLGGSHGGFMTTWLAAHHGDRFRAAVSERAVNAVDSMMGTSDIGWYFVDEMYGPDHAAASPLTHADRITVPMLIVHSDQDLRCPLEQAQRLFVALKRRGVPVEMLVFPGGSHELSRTGRLSHRIARFEAILEWLDRWLSPRR